MTRTDTTTTEIIDTLDSFYCYNITAALWADAVINRLQGLAIFLLGDELAEVADRARAAARQLAGRIGDLGGAITADPRQLLDRSIPVEFALPDCSDVASIGEYGLQRLNAIIGAYEASLGQAGPAAAPRGFETDLPPGEFQKLDGRTPDRGLGEGGE